MSLVVRAAGPSDVPALAQLRAAWHAEAHGEVADPGFPERFAAWWHGLQPHLLAWLAEDPEPVGMVSVHAVPKMPSPGGDAPGWGYVTAAYVRPRARNRGVGSALVAGVTAYADQQRWRRLVLHPRPQSGRFWARHGFVAADRLVLREPAGAL